MTGLSLKLTLSGHHLIRMTARWKVKWAGRWGGCWGWGVAGGGGGGELLRQVRPPSSAPRTRTLLDQAAVRLGLGKVKDHKAGLILGQGLDHGLEDLGVGLVGGRLAALLDVPAKDVLARRRASLLERKDNVLVRLLELQGVVQRQELVANVNARLARAARGRGGAGEGTGGGRARARRAGNVRQGRAGQGAEQQGRRGRTIKQLHEMPLQI